MKFEGKSVRSLSKLLVFTEKHPKVRFAFNVDGVDPSIWTKLGFDTVLEPGDCLIPSCIGRASTFNAHGKEVIRKDLPMVNKSFPVFTSWQDWHGQTHSGIQYRDRDVYQREYIPAPSEFLYVIEMDSSFYIATREIDIPREAEVNVLHLANLMLECFGEFDSIDARSGIKVGTRLKRLQWEVLPPGPYPWSKAKPLVDAYTEHLDESARELIGYRMGTIAGYKPGFLATGRGGFNAYFVYGFEDQGVYLLESAHLDNATYVFKEDWERLSQLTKSEIINGDIPHARIVHNRKWGANIRAAIFDH
jgi:hypothetical protein